MQRKITMKLNMGDYRLKAIYKHIQGLPAGPHLSGAIYNEAK